MQVDEGVLQGVNGAGAGTLRQSIFEAETVPWQLPGEAARAPQGGAMVMAGEATQVPMVLLGEATQVPDKPRSPLAVGGGGAAPGGAADAADGGGGLSDDDLDLGL